MTDYRYDKLSELFTEYSNGNFDYKIEPSEKLDEIDAFISSVNMLGEELKETTISKQFFNNVFNSVSDLIFVLSINGEIQRVNKTVTDITRLSEEELCGLHIDFLFENEKKSFFAKALKKSKNESQNFSSTFYSSNTSTPILCSINGFYDELQNHLGYILFIKDLSSLKKVEKAFQQSEEKYQKLFNESGDAIAIVSNKGKFIEVNSAAIVLFGLNNSSNKGSIYKFLDDPHDFDKLEYSLNSIDNFQELVVKIKNRVLNNIYTCLVSTSKLSNSPNYLIILKDISDQIEMENLVIRTIVDTQENERKRFARDIHDSLGQQLSAVKFYLSSLNSKNILDEKNKNLIIKTELGLKNILANIREICFNLMPKTLENFGLILAVRELANSVELKDEFECKIIGSENFPRLSHEKEIAIFRIIQEFINNSVKHSKGDKLLINFSFNEFEIEIKMKDNGVGFDMNDIKNNSGMGLKNTESRARSYNGKLTIFSEKNKGTNYLLKIPII